MPTVARTFRAEPSCKHKHKLVVKQKLSLEQAMKGPELEYMYSSTLSLTLTLDGGERSTPRPCRFTRGKRHGTHCTGGWVGTRAGLDGCGKSRFHWDSIPEMLSPQPVAVPTTISRPTQIGGTWGKKMTI
jgi:hypothetical protein